jgi:hypothetical protein
VATKGLDHRALETRALETSVIIAVRSPSIFACMSEAD